MSVQFRTSDGVLVPFPASVSRLNNINPYNNVHFNDAVIDVDIPSNIWWSAVLFAKMSEKADQNVDEETRVKLIMQRSKLQEDKIDQVIEALEILGSDVDVGYLEYYKKKRF
jgi:hypothetical protein